MKFTKIRTRLIDRSRASAEEIRHEKIVFPRKERKKSFEVPHLYCTSHEYENRGRFFRGPRENSSSTLIEGIYLPKFRVWHFEDIRRDTREVKIYPLRLVCITYAKNVHSNIINNVYINNTWATKEFTANNKSLYNFSLSGKNCMTFRTAWF